MGLVSVDALHDLKLISKIRNLFAHDMGASAVEHVIKRNFAIFGTAKSTASHQWLAKSWLSLVPCLPAPSQGNAENAAAEQ